MSNQKLADALRTLIAANEQQENTDYLAARDMAMDAAREALAEHDARTFSDDASDMAERASIILRTRVVSLTQMEKLLALARAAYNVAEHAYENPAYQEPQR